MPLSTEVAAAFRAYALPTETNLFGALSAAVRWEEVGKGRRGAVLTDVDAERGTPIVRTTTRYATPAQRFGPEHERLARLVEGAASLPARFNHALVERYTKACTTMGAHSDQALDLEDDSSIALFSCYEDPARATPLRRLRVQSKVAGGEEVDVALPHHGVVVFSAETNRRFRHRIVLVAPASAPDNPWLGVTFRRSKTFVRDRDGRTLLADDTPLVLADEAQRREFYGLRRRENEETDFVYPPIGYTVSESDLMPPVRVGS